MLASSGQKGGSLCCTPEHVLLLSFMILPPEGEQPKNFLAELWQSSRKSDQTQAHIGKFAGCWEAGPCFLLLGFAVLFV